MSASREYNIGLIGYGTSSRTYHIPLINSCPGLRIHSVVQRAPAPQGLLVEKEQEAHVAIDYPGIKHYQHTSELLADENVDLVVLATPTFTHYELAKQAIEANKHVLVDKPFCPTTRECDELIDLAKSKNKILSIFHNRRLDSDFLTFTSLSTSPPTARHLFPLIEFVSHFDRYAPTPTTRWKTLMEPGSGALYDIGADLIDQVLTLFGLPTWVNAFLPNQRTSDPLDIEDAFTVLLYYEATKDKNDGKPMQIELKSSMVSVAERQLRYRARGWQGSWTKYHIDAQEEQLKEHGIRAPSLPGYGSELPSNYGTLVTIDPVETNKERSSSSDEFSGSEHSSKGFKEQGHSQDSSTQTTSTTNPNQAHSSGQSADTKMVSFVSPPPPPPPPSHQRNIVNPRHSSSSEDEYPHKYQKMNTSHMPDLDSPSSGSKNSGSSGSYGSGSDLSIRDRETGYYICRTRAAKGDYVAFYRNMYSVLTIVSQHGVNAEDASKDLMVNSIQARDVIMIIELAKQSHITGRRMEVKEKLMGLS